MIEINVLLTSDGNAAPDSRALVRRALQLQMSSVPGISVRDDDDDLVHRARNPIAALLVLAASVGAAYQALCLAKNILQRRGLIANLTVNGPHSPLAIPNADDPSILAWLKIADAAEE